MHFMINRCLSYKVTKHGKLFMNINSIIIRSISDILKQYLLIFLKNKKKEWIDYSLITKKKEEVLHSRLFLYIEHKKKKKEFFFPFYLIHKKTFLKRHTHTYINIMYTKGTKKSDWNVQITTATKKRFTILTPMVFFVYENQYVYHVDDPYPLHHHLNLHFDSYYYSYYFDFVLLMMLTLYVLN